MMALTLVISIPVAVVAFFVAAFLFIWAYNLSFAAHMLSEEKQMMRYHYGSFLVTLVALGLVLLGVLIL